MKPERIREGFPSGLTQASLTRENPVLPGVKLVGIQSKHGRKYSLDCLSKAVKLYEGKPVYINHPTQEKRHELRSFESKFGVIRNVRVGSDGLYGDMHCNPRHALFEQFAGWVELDPNEIGLSHSAFAVLREAGNGLKEVVEIKSVESVDLVATPATTQGLFEGIAMEDDVLTPEPVETGSQGLDEALSQLVASILKDDSLDVKAKGKKILHALKILEDDSVAKTEEATEDEGEEKEEEEMKAEEAINRFTKRIGTLLEEAITGFENRLKKVKSPVSIAPKRSEKKLTVDDLLKEVTK